MKSGIDYFPLDVTLDSKFELIEAEFGLTGFGVVVKLFQKIYGEQGYYLEWTNEVALLFAKKIGLGGSVVSEIVEASVKRGIFDRDLYDKYHVLSSSGIQKRYFEAVSRRKEIEVDPRYLLVKAAQICKNVDIKPKNVNISSENADIFKQSRVEKSRVKKSKEPLPQGSGCGDDLSELLLLWEKINGRPVTAYEGEKILALLEVFSPARVTDAMKIAGDSGKRTLNYVDGILNRWQAQGRDSKKPEKGRPKKSGNDYDILLNR